MQAQEDDRKDRMIELLEELVKWTRVTSIPRVKKLLLEILPKDKHKIAYHYTDGRPSTPVAKRAGVSFKTVTEWWKIWIRAGIAEPMKAPGGQRARRIFALEDFGIDVPPPKKAKVEKKESEEAEEEITEDAVA